MRESFIAPECCSCLIETAFKFLKTGTRDYKHVLQGMREALDLLEKEFSEDNYTFLVGNKLARHVHQFLKEENPDIFRDIKDKSNEVCLSIFPDLTRKYEEIQDEWKKFQYCIAAGVAGNVIDVGTAGHDFSLEPEEIFKIINQVQHDGFAVDDSRVLFELIKNEKVHHFLVMLDNAGEIVFDKLLLRFLKEHVKEVTCMVRGGPIANDATLHDAISAGIDEWCDGFLETTIPSLGYTIPDNDAKVVNAVNSMDVVIGKGQANNETLSTYADEIDVEHVFVLCKVKCTTVSRWKKVKKGDNLLQKVK
ncbi:DUF89 family protein [Candidatus Bathyarchaeota archaeon]|nr:DUF89 family protein [Candidatus Bathyarchaeota archaeon]